jgi:anthranilate phosphoribosyltransferase
MNAAAALVTGEKAKDFLEAAGMASNAIDSGAAREKLEEVKKVSNSL